MVYSEKLQKLINQAIHCDGLTDEILSELREIADKEREDFKEIESVLKVINESRNQPWIIKCKGNDTLEVVGTEIKQIQRKRKMSRRESVDAEIAVCDMKDICYFKKISGGILWRTSYVFMGSEDVQIVAKGIEGEEIDKLYHVIETVNPNCNGTGIVYESKHSILDYICFRWKKCFRPEIIILLKNSITYINRNWFSMKEITQIPFKDIKYANVTKNKQVIVYGDQSIRTKWNFDSKFTKKFEEIIKEVLLADAEHYSPSYIFNFSTGPDLFLCKDSVILTDKKETKILRYEDIDCYFRIKEGFPSRFFGYGTVFISGKPEYSRVVMEVKQIGCFNWRWFWFFSGGIRKRLKNSPAKNNKKLKDEVLKLRKK